jgi:hypothetical protein
VMSAGRSRQGAAPVSVLYHALRGPCAAQALGERHGAAMQLFRKAVLSAPTSFLARASLRHAVLLACFAAASPDTGAGAEGAATGAFAAGLVGALTTAAKGHRQMPRIAAADLKTQGDCLIRARITPTHHETDDARMKLA